MNSLMKQASTSSDKRLLFRRLDLNSLLIKVYSDGSFNDHPDESSQVGYVVFLTDKRNKSKLIDYSSITSRRVAISVLGAENFGLADACDAPITVQN